MKKKIIFAKIGKEHRFRLSLSLSKDWQYPAKERFREIPNERQIKKKEKENAVDKKTGSQKPFSYWGLVISSTDLYISL